MRELSSQKVVFETRALHDSPWGDAFALLPAMLDSALLGFPQPPAGTRRINVEISKNDGGGGLEDIDVAAA